jgi:molecular chaperone GrpE
MADHRKVPVHIKHARDDEGVAVPEVGRALEEREEPQAAVPAERAEADLGMWRDRAQRLQAEMENYRKRQQRMAEARILEERERLLRAFLEIVDNLERALGAGEVDVASLRQGVSVTFQAAAQLLDREGVEPIAAKGRPFDPAWHEAMGSVPGSDGIEPGTVVEVVQRGYRLGDSLLRPARVIVSA